MDNDAYTSAPVHRLVGLVHGHITEGEYFGKVYDALWTLLDRICVTETSREEAFDLIIEYIIDLRAALQSASSFLPYHEPSHTEYEGMASDTGRRVRLALNPTCGCSPFPPNTKLTGADAQP